VSNLTSELLFKAFASVALADDVLTPDEQTVLDGLAARLEIAEPDAKRWIAEARDARRRGPIQLPEDANDRVELLEGMVKVAAADGVILPSERKLIEQVREQLGIDPKRLESLTRYHLSAAAAKAGAAPGKSEAGDARESFRILVAVAFADGVLAPEELALLDRIRARFGIEAAEATRVIDSIKADRRALDKLDLSKHSKSGGELFEEMVKIAAADGVIHPSERALLERARRVLGVDSKRLASLLAYAAPGQEKAPVQEPGRPWLLLIAVGLAAVGLVLFFVLRAR
jgi:uncharacterized tellurite resistance protein B-like protein